MLAPGGEKLLWAISLGVQAHKQWGCLLRLQFSPGQGLGHYRLFEFVPIAEV